MTPKEELLDNLEREYQALQDVLHGLSAEQIRRRELGDWSVKEIVAHLTGWHRQMIPVLERIARGQHPFPDGFPYQDPQPWNDRFAAASAGRTPEAVLEEFEESHRDFAAAAAAIPDLRLKPGRTAHRIVHLNGPDHYRHHAGQIAAWARK